MRKHDATLARNQVAINGWLLILGGLGAFDAWRATKHDGSTLSEVTRSVFGTHQPTGRAVFLASLTAGSAVLAVLIIKQKTD